MRPPIRSGLILALLAASPALAHPGHGGAAMAGFTHPFNGADHLAAMLLVGLWAAMRGGRAVVVWPATFAAALLAGYGLGSVVHGLPLVEPAILASVIGLGALVAADVRVGTAAGVGLIALAGLAHGVAHGAEAEGATLGFPLGMTAATVILHGAGLVAGLALKTLCRPGAIRLLGAGAAVGGVALAVLG